MYVRIHLYYRYTDLIYICNIKCRNIKSVIMLITRRCCDNHTI